MGRHYPAPIERKQLSQLRNNGNPIAAQHTLCEQIKHGQEKKWFVRGAM